MPTALVTGVAGFIGSNLAEALLDRGYEVRGVDTFVTGRRANIDSFRDHPEFTFREVDIRDGEAIEPLMRGTDTVFHQAAAVSVEGSVEDPITTSDSNCVGTATVLDTARRADVDTVVVASSAALYGSGGDLPKVESMPSAPESPYGLSKQYTEALAVQASELYALDTVALRYFNVFGPRQDPHGEYAAVIPAFIDRVLDGEPPVIYGDGEQTRDFVFVDDVVRANIAAAEADASGVVCNIARGAQTSINDLAETLTDLLGVDLAPVHEAPRPGDIRHSYADISRARDELGYAPQVSFREGLERTIEYYRKQ
jgi:nucleoside-diphosphate-sugar epimerase